MKRLFSEFNANIKRELEEMEPTKPNPVLVAFKTQQYETAYANFRKLANQEGALTRQINRIEKTDPSTAQTLRDNRDEIRMMKGGPATKKNPEQNGGAYAVAKSHKTDLNRITGKDYLITVNVFNNAKSSNPDYQKPVQIMKSSLLALRNPVLTIMKEQAERIKYEIAEAKAKVEQMNNELFDLSVYDIAKLTKMEGSLRGLNILYQKALCNILMEKNGTDFEETLEDNYDLLQDLADFHDSGETGSNGSPYFYVPAGSFIDIQ